MENSEAIKRNKLVVDAFGYWPDFHDAEIHWLRLDRSRETYEGYFSPCIELCIHAFEMTSEKDEKGYFKLIKHHLIHFRFNDVYDVELDGFNNQNAISELQINPFLKSDSGQPAFEVVIHPAYGLGGEFKALSAEVLSVLPCDDKGVIANQEDTPAENSGR